MRYLAPVASVVFAIILPALAAHTMSCSAAQKAGEKKALD